MEDEATGSGMGNYLERWATLFESFGAPPMFGRLTGWLLVCEPPEQTPRDIAEGVSVSLSSVSSAMKMLLQVGMVERWRKPGERSTYYHLRPESWGLILERRLGAIRAMRHLAQEGLELKGTHGGGHGGKRDASHDRRLEEVMRYCDFVDREFVQLMERWKEEREEWNDD